MGKKSSKKSSRGKSAKSPPPPPTEQELFGDSKRYRFCGGHGPSISGCQLIAVYRNSVAGYTTRTMRRVGNIKTAWHGTCGTYVLKKIAVDGLLSPLTLHRRGLRRRPGGGMLGPGIYTSPNIYKAYMHAGGERGSSGFRYILKCLVALGNPNYVDSVGYYDRNSPIYDSVVALAYKPIAGVYGNNSMLRNEEWVVYNAEQVVVDEVLIYWNPPRSREYFSSYFRSRQAKEERIKQTMHSHPCHRNGKVCVYAYGNLKPGCIELSKKQCTEEDAKYCTSYRSSRK